MKYHGGKNGSGVYQRLICMMPPHRTYIEGFLGSGAILRRKRPAEKSIAYELSRAAIAEIRDHLPAEHFEPSPLNAEWIPPGPLPGCGGTSIIYHEPGTSRPNLEIFNVDVVDMLRNRYAATSAFWGYNDPAETLIYLDPPYPRAVRSSKSPIYEFELMERHEHAELCEILTAIPCKIMLSGYDNDLYNDILKGWRTQSIPTTNRAGARVIETVWLNFPEPVELHDYNHAGENFRDRWRITKRLRNWTGQLKAMAPAERGAMLAELAAAMNEFNAAGRAADAAATARTMKKALRAAKSTRNPPAAASTPEPARQTPLFNEPAGPDSFGGTEYD